MIYVVRTWKNVAFTDYFVEASTSEYALDKVISQTDKATRVDRAIPWRYKLPKGVTVLQ